MAGVLLSQGAASRGLRKPGAPLYGLNKLPRWPLPPAGSWRGNLMFSICPTQARVSAITMLVQQRLLRQGRLNTVSAAMNAQAGEVK